MDVKHFSVESNRLVRLSRPYGRVTLEIRSLLERNPGGAKTAAQGVPNIGEP